jgi:hypothetical protein
MFLLAQTQLLVWPAITAVCCCCSALLCSAADASANKPMSVQQLRRRATLPMMDRPAQLQGYGQLMVDVPVDTHYPTIQEVRAV